MELELDTIPRPPKLTNIEFRDRETIFTYIIDQNITYLDPNTKQWKTLAFEPITFTDTIRHRQRQQQPQQTVDWSRDGF